MKLNRISFFVVFSLLIYVQACKDDNVTQNNGGNNNLEPGIPQLFEPVNNGTIAGVTPVFKWQSYENASSYRLQVSLDANFAGTMLSDTTVNTTETTINANLPYTNIYYYWRVSAQLQSGNSEWSSVWRFTLILPPPAAPNLLSPANNSGNIPFIPLFDWDDPATAQTYRLQVSANQNFTQVLLDTSRIPVSQLLCPPMILNTSSQYYWRVNASNSNGVSTGDWSSIYNFTTVSGPEPNSISGTITFADNNFYQPPFYYTAAIFYTGNWPPTLLTPVKFDSLGIQQSGNTYTANYKIRRIPNGSYYLATAPKSNIGFTGDLLGLYGCDTNRVPFSSCPYTPAQVTISNNNGVVNINFLSWADSTKPIF